MKKEFPEVEDFARLHAAYLLLYHEIVLENAMGNNTPESIADAQYCCRDTLKTKINLCTSRGAFLSIKIRIFFAKPK
jgi:hypothetical protein